MHAAVWHVNMHACASHIEDVEVGESKDGVDEHGKDVLQFANHSLCVLQCHNILEHDPTLSSTAGTDSRRKHSCTCFVIQEIHSCMLQPMIMPCLEDIQVSTEGHNSVSVVWLHIEPHKNDQHCQHYLNLCCDQTTLQSSLL